MKKFLFALVAVFALATTSVNAQAVGVRLGGGSAYDAELSLWTGVDANRWEFDLGWNNYYDWTNVTLTGIYQWNWNLVGSLDWFAGVGAQVTLYDVTGSMDYGVGLGGQIGLALNLDPFVFSLDARPMWNFIGHSENWGGVALGIRYKL